MDAPYESVQYVVLIDQYATTHTETHRHPGIGQFGGVKNSAFLEVVPIACPNGPRGSGTFGTSEYPEPIPVRNCAGLVAGD